MPRSKLGPQGGETTKIPGGLQRDTPRWFRNCPDFRGRHDLLSLAQAERPRKQPNMKKAEIFSLVAGVLGFAVDLIALLSLLHTNQELSEVGLQGTWPLWSIILLVYSWLLISWFLTTLGWRREQRRHPSRIYNITSTPFLNVAVASVAGSGILFIPITLMIIYPLTWNQGGDLLVNISGLAVSSILAVSLIGAAIFGAVMCLMPLIHDDVSFE